MADFLLSWLLLLVVLTVLALVSAYTPDRCVDALLRVLRFDK